MTAPAGREPIGLIGLGQMGAAMCRTLRRAGWDVVAWDIAEGAIAAAHEAGAAVESDPSGVAERATIVITSLPDGAAVREVAFGERGLAAGAGHCRLVVDTSTTSPSDARRLADDLRAHGIAFLDAPVSGGVRGAETGNLAIMVGGAIEDLEAARPILSCLGEAVVHCGATGAGQVAKACNQLVVMSTIESTAEALTLARAAGIDPWRVREALLLGFAASPILEMHGARMLRGEFAPGGRAVYHLKDIATIRALAAETHLTLPGFAAAAGQFERLVEGGGGDLDHAALVTVVEQPTRSGHGDEASSTGADPPLPVQVRPVDG